jgi:hypothetical protein
MFQFSLHRFPVASIKQPPARLERARAAEASAFQHRDGDVVPRQAENVALELPQRREVHLRTGAGPSGPVGYGHGPFAVRGKGTGRREAGAVEGWLRRVVLMRELLRIQ